MIRRYLDKYGEADAALASTIDGAWERVLAIPACSEGPALVETLRSVADAEGGNATLALVTVNAPADGPPHFHTRNEACLTMLREALRDAAALPGAAGFRGRLGDLDVAIIDRASQGRRLPAGQGVGLARKIGADIAAALVDEGRVTSPLIWMTDADVVVPRTYFRASADAGHAAAMTVPFRHVASEDPGQAQAGQLYDLSLRYYVLGLAHAGSPYAYHTIGSTVVAEANAYAKVRGFPRRTAAEDFYLLGKLAKVGGVYRASGAPIEVAARLSDRVPFGTGAAITRLGGDAAGRDAFALYDPRSFRALSAWLEALRGAVRARDARAWAPPDGLSDATREKIAAMLGVPKALTTACAASPKVAVRLRHIDTWFDAFKTLKLIHALRDEVWASLPWSEALERAEFLDVARELGEAHAGVIAADEKLHGTRVGPA